MKTYIISRIQCGTLQVQQIVTIPHGTTIEDPKTGQDMVIVNSVEAAKRVAPYVLKLRPNEFVGVEAKL